MNGWGYHNPVQITFGEGALDEISTVVAGRRYLLVTYGDAYFCTLVERVKRCAGAPIAVLDGIEPNPSLGMLRRVCGRLRASGLPEVLVALGGGSVLDTAKFLAAGHGGFEQVLHYLETGQHERRRALPIVAIPTTSGTGSDVTSWATVWDPERQRKLSLARDDLYAEAALIDPTLTYALPWATTLASGLDALSHALESIWNVNASPITRAHAARAVPELMSGLTRLASDLDDHGARRMMSLGALCAGLAFSNTKTALAHNISYPITLKHGVAHGIACSFCLPEVMIAALGSDAACDAALTEIFGGQASAAPDVLRGFLESLGVSGRPDAYGVAAEEWNAIVREAFDGPRRRNFIGAIERFPFEV